MTTKKSALFNTVTQLVLTDYELTQRAKNPCYKLSKPLKKLGASHEKENF